MTVQDVVTLRLALCANGYTPLPLYGKVPPIFGKNNQRRGLDKWEQLDNINREQVEMWGRLWPDATNTGILTRLTPAFDLGIFHEEAAIAAETLARERFEERGYFLVRIGLPPKRAFVFRTLDPFDKITVNFTQTRNKPEKIEFLCNGQQLVAEGIHPDTKQPYRWFGGEPWEIKHEDLPYISAEEAQQLVDDMAEMLCRDFGYSRKQDRPKRKSKGNGPFANEADWQYLYDNILKGDELHDSLRDLAAKLIASGMHPGAAVNQLRALMMTSNAPHDDRWNARFDDIPRLVDSAVEKYQNPQLQPLLPSPSSASPPPPPPPPSSPSAQSASPQPGAAPQSGTSPIENTLKIFREWLLLDNDTPVLAMLGTVAANMLPGDAIWLGIIAPPSSAKTEMLITLVNIPHTEMVGTLSIAGLLSGTPRRQQAAGARGGLLQKIGPFGFLVLKDFGSILSLRPDTKLELLAALREIYDGKWTRVIGVDGGRVLQWSGKIGLLFGCTRVFDSYYGVINELGDRFLLCRMEPNKKQFLHAIKHANRAAQLRARLVEAVTNLFTVPLPAPRDISDKEIKWLNEILQVVVRLRGAVKRDYRTRELEDVYGAEGPARLGKALERVLAGLDCLGVKRGKARKVIRIIAFDSVPPNRLRVYKHLKKIEPAWADTSTTAKAVDLPTVTTRRVLEELVVYGLAERDKQGQGKADLWRTV